MHPPKIAYQGTDYDLSHLGQTIQQFIWTPKGKSAAIMFSVRVRFGNHCYSKEITGTASPTDFVVDKRPLRVFCPHRHNYSLDLPTIIGGLFTKPGTTISQTVEGNWHVYKLYVRTGVSNKYCLFFTIRKNADLSLDNGALPVDLFVQSAYVRERVETTKKMPFGTVVSQIWE